MRMDRGRPKMQRQTSSYVIFKNEDSSAIEVDYGARDREPGVCSRARAGRGWLSRCAGEGSGNNAYVTSANLEFRREDDTATRGIESTNRCETDARGAAHGVR